MCVVSYFSGSFTLKVFIVPERPDTALGAEAVVQGLLGRGAQEVEGRNAHFLRGPCEVRTVWESPGCGRLMPGSAGFTGLSQM